MHRKLFYMDLYQQPQQSTAKASERKNRCELSFAAIWQREKDLNPRIRSQSPLCYHYTIPLKARIIIPFFTDLSRANFKIPHIF